MTYSLDTLTQGSVTADAPTGLSRFAHELSLVLAAVALLLPRTAAPCLAHPSTRTRGSWPAPNRSRFQSAAAGL
jgi:hypothetical protein